MVVTVSKKIDFMVEADRIDGLSDKSNPAISALLEDVYYGNHALISVGEQIEESFLKDGREKDWESIYRCPVENLFAETLKCDHSGLACGFYNERTGEEFYFIVGGNSNGKGKLLITGLVDEGSVAMLDQYFKSEPLQSLGFSCDDFVGKAKCVSVNREKPVAEITLEFDLSGLNKERNNNVKGKGLGD